MFLDPQLSHIEIGHVQNSTFRAIMTHFKQNEEYISHIVRVMLFHEASLHIKCNLFEEILLYKYI